MDAIAAEELQAACMEVLQQVQATGRAVCITRRGKPIATVVPEPAKKSPREKTPKRLGTAVKGGKSWATSPCHPANWPTRTRWANKRF